MKILFKKILNVFTYLAIVVAIVFGLPKFLSHSLKTPYPMAAITSGSMWPSLKEGDLVFIQGTDPAHLEVGDIVVFRSETSHNFIIHRVVAISSKTFTTKGDANFREDEPARFENLVGKILTIKNRNVRVPHLGSITVFASNLKEERKNSQQ